MATSAAASIAATVAPAKKTPKELPAPNSDFYQLADVLTAEEKAIVKRVRTYMETKVQPIINKYWSEDAFPFELLPSFKELGLGGLGYEGYGCAGGTQKLFGLVAMELARGRRPIAGRRSQEPARGAGPEIHSPIRTLLASGNRRRDPMATV